MSSFFELFILFLYLFVGLFIILTSNPVHSILGLVLIFFMGACLSIFIGVEFLALVILIVYVGAVSVLFLFVVMLLNVRVLELNVNLLKYWWFGALYSTFFMLNLYYTFFSVLGMKTCSVVVVTYLDYSEQILDWNAASQLGELLFTLYPHLLMASALVLFIAIVSPVVLTYVSFERLKGPQGGTKTQNIFLQTLRVSVDKNWTTTTY